MEVNFGIRKVTFIEKEVYQLLNILMEKNIGIMKETG